MRKTKKDKELDEQITKKLWEIVNLAVKNSGGRLRLAYQEKDKSKRIYIGASHFLKLDEKRLGKDIEVYIFSGSQPPNWRWHDALNQFAVEVTAPLAEILPETYEKAYEQVNELRETLYLRGGRNAK